MIFFKKIIFLIGFFLLGINIYGLFKSLRNPAIYTEQNTWFVSDITEKYPDINKKLARKNNETDKDFAARLTTLVHNGILHYWEDEGLSKYHLTVPAWENYLLYAASWVDPKKYRKYEFTNYKKNLERGIGLCSTHSLVLQGILNDNGIDADLLDIRHHVALRTKVDKNEWWILDPDYGVVVPYDTAAVHADPQLILTAYKDMNSLYKPEIKKHYTPEYLAGLYGGEGNRIYTVNNWFESFSYWAIWIIPFLLMLPYAINLFRRIKSPDFKNIPIISRTSFILLFLCFNFFKAPAQNVSKTYFDASNRATNTSDKTFVAPAKGPLQALAENPNYFTDGSGKAIYLVGSHTWSNFQDMYFEGDKKFDYDQYMDFMVENHFNFMRFWTWEQSAWATWTSEKLIVDPVPYLRTGPGFAIDGKPKYDLTKFDQSYFDRMRARIIKARDHGIYASIMLFQAFSGVVTKFAGHDNNVFRGHYYNKENNIQHFNGDKNGDNVLDIDDPKVREYQAAYIKEIIDNVWDLDNILYEVINEGGTLNWDRFVIKTVEDYEKIKGKQHPIGITGHGCEKLEDMLQSTAQWISPGTMDDPIFRDVKNNPPLWAGKKVSVLDTDHIWGHGMDYHWVWYSFLRGHNVLFMDPWDPLPGWLNPQRNIPDLYNYVQGRKAMKNTAILASQINLALMKPSTEMTSGGFCLANPGKEYVVYVKADTATIDLTGISGNFSVEWMHPTEGFITKGRDIKGGGKEILSTPFKEDAVAHIKLIE